jgi:hypothetical protein
LYHMNVEITIVLNRMKAWVFSRGIHFFGLWAEEEGCCLWGLELANPA